MTTDSRLRAFAWNLVLPWLVVVLLLAMCSADVLPDDLEPAPSAKSVEVSSGLAVGVVSPGAQYTGTPTDVTYQGAIAYADPSYGPRYLALPEPRGTVATICGPAACVTRTSTDVGPSLKMQRAGRIADVSSVDFEAICGELRFGLCPGTVTIERRPRVTLPPTSTE